MELVLLDPRAFWSAPSILAQLFKETERNESPESVLPCISFRYPGIKKP